MKIGLVLSGGGGKGAYELGVWKALKKLNIDKHIEVFAGTSIGAFNAVLFAQDDMEAAEKLWDEVTMDKLVPLSKLQLFKKGIGLMIGGKNPNFAVKYMSQKFEEGAVSKSGAIDIIEKYLNIDNMKTRNKICYAACTQLPDLKVKYFRINDYDDVLGKEIIIASASLPLIYDCTEILGEKYIDGGVVDNTPIQPVYGEGCDIIIVVTLNKGSVVNRELYPKAKIIEIFPKNLDETVLTGTLNLDEIAKKNRIKEGYNDTINLLEPIMQMIEFKVQKEEEEKYPKLFKMYRWAKNLKTKKENNVEI